MNPWKRRFLLTTIIFRFHVSFRGGMGFFQPTGGSRCIGGCFYFWSWMSQLGPNVFTMDFSTKGHGKPTRREIHLDFGQTCHPHPRKNHWRKQRGGHCGDYKFLVRGCGCAKKHRVVWFGCCSFKKVP